MQCNTVGELRKVLEQWPDEKPIILDYDGNTTALEVLDWSPARQDDISWPVVIQPV